MGQSECQQELLESFSELRVIGQELADKIKTWAEDNLDEDKIEGTISPEMSGDAVVLFYTEQGIEEATIAQMLTAVGFAPQDDSDDTVVAEVEKPPEVGEWMNCFLEHCIEVKNRYPCFVKGIAMDTGDDNHKAAVRIVIPSSADFRMLSSKDARKIMFMYFLKDIRAEAQRFSMIDEAMCYCATKKEFLLVFRPLAKPKRI